MNNRKIGELFKYEDCGYDAAGELYSLSVVDYCGKQKKVIVPKHFMKMPVEEIANQTFSKKQIESIRIPNTVKNIGAGAFEDCKNLKAVTLNEGLKAIEFDAFQGTSIEKITIPSTVKKIGERAFANCSELTRIKCKIKKSYVEANEYKFEGLLENKDIINWLNG